MAGRQETTERETAPNIGDWHLRASARKTRLFRDRPSRVGNRFVHGVVRSERTASELSDWSKCMRRQLREYYHRFSQLRELRNRLHSRPRVHGWPVRDH
jgi:hypothetical protein